MQLQRMRFQSLVNFPQFIFNQSSQTGCLQPHAGRKDPNVKLLVV